MPTLCVHVAEGVPQQFVLEPGRYSLGRAPDSAIWIDDPSVSERHCELTLYASGEAVIRDAGSSNGTWVDGVGISVGTVVPGQDLRLGSVRVTLEADDAGTVVPTWPTEQPEAAPTHGVQAAAAQSVWRALPGALAYPLSGDAWMSIVWVILLQNVHWILPQVIQPVGMVTGAIAGLFLLQWGREILTATSNGDDRPPSNPDLLTGWAEIRERIFLYAAVGLISFGPALAARMIPGIPVAIAVLLTLAGFAYFPMALLCVVLLDTPGALAPSFVLQSIARVLPGYTLVVLIELVLTGLGYGMDWSGAWAAAPAWARVSLTVALSALGVYGGLVWLRLLGLLYRYHKDDLAWEY